MKNQNKLKFCAVICIFLHMIFSVQNVHSQSTPNPTPSSRPTSSSSGIKSPSVSSSVRNEEVVEKLCTRLEKYNETKLVEILKPIKVRYFAWCAAVPPRCSRYRIQNETEIQLVPVERSREVKICCEGFQQIQTGDGQKCKKIQESTKTNSVSLSAHQDFGACGGILKKDSGNFQLQKSDFESLGEKGGKYLCIFIIQAAQGNSMRFKLNEIQMENEETRINLYPENYFSGLKNPRENLKILNRSHVNSTIEISGNVLTLLISGIKNGANGNRNDSLVSFSWQSIPKLGRISSVPNSVSSASAAHQTTKTGKIIWDEFQSKNPSQSTFTNFNLFQIPLRNSVKNSHTSSLTLQLSAEFPVCEDFDPCRCNSIQIYRILADGNLHLLSRYCGISVENLKIKNLPMQILTVAQVNSQSLPNSNSASNCGKQFVGVSWETEEKDKSTSVSCTDSTRQIKDLKCPGLEVDLEPCTCAAGFGLDLRCSGQEVTQARIDHLFTAVRQVNNLRENDLLHFSRVTVTNTILKTLDLTPLLKSSGEEVSILRNRQLTSIKVNKVNQVNNSIFEGAVSSFISTEELRVQYNPLTDSGVGDLLKYLDPQKLTRLTVKDTQIQGSRSTANGNENNTEFLPGLSSLINLAELHLDDNQIRELGGGQFRRNTKLTQLTLGSNDQTLKKIGLNSFLFDDVSSQPSQPSNGVSSQPSNGTRTLNSSLRIYLGLSGLKNENFISSPSTGEDLLGLTSIKRPVTLDLTHNEIDHISETTFKQFLLSNPQNKIDAQGNLLQCDRKMKWLKDNRNVLQSQVLNALCSNDRTKKSVFETTLI